MKQEHAIDLRKAAIIGCGFVGSATAFTLMQSRLFSELVLLDVNMEKADGEAKDIAHGIPFAGQMKIYAGTYDDAADAEPVADVVSREPICTGLAESLSARFLVVDAGSAGLAR